MHIVKRIARVCDACAHIKTQFSVSLTIKTVSVNEGGRAVRGVRRVNFRLPLFTWGEAGAGRERSEGKGVRLRAVQGQERRASARCTGAPATGHSRAAHAQGPVLLVTRRERDTSGARPEPALDCSSYSPWRRRSCSSMKRAASSSVSRRLISTLSGRLAVQARPLSRRDWPRAPLAAHVAEPGHPMAAQRECHVTGALHQSQPAGRAT
ncbi:unnamed protein product [Arctia plantaginis]|uniref:Uncharacterized protein n=1 Tax=Arctia plantaginis TaxID=874455 RepID=A0A8S1BFK9_ARCPL|nr:unnamed protein product [Arctia plantaginis]